MPKSTESINQDLEDLLTSRGYDVTALDSAGKEVPVASDADVFQFHFHKDGKDYGTVTISIDGLQKLTIYYDDEISNSGSGEDDERGMSGTSWISLVKQLKKFSMQHQLGFVLKDTDRLRTDMKRRTHTKKLEEGAVKELDYDIKDKKMSDEEFKEKYKMTRAEARSELGLMTKKKIKEDAGVPDDEAAIRKKMAEYKAAAQRAMDNGKQGRAKYYFDSYKELQAKLPKSKTGLDIDRTVPGIIRARISNVDPETMGNKLDKLASFGNFQSGVADQGRSGRVGPKISADNYTQRDDVAETQVQTMRRYYAGEKDAKDQTKIAQMRDYFNAQDKKQNDTMNKNKTQQPTMAEDNYDLSDRNNIRTTIQRTTFNPGQEVVHNGKIVKVIKTLGSGLIEIDTGAGKIAVKPSALITDTGRRDYDLSDRNNIHSTKESVNLAEGYYGNKKMSYSDDTPQVKMVIKHNRQLEETDQRFRHIDSIFLETSDGERFRAPTNKPSRARAFARHIAEGGAYKDERWTHIAEMCEDLDKLGGFVRATTAKREQFNESAQRMISEAVEQYQSLRETLKRVSSSRGYNKYFESYQPTVITEADDDLLETFKQSTVDSRIENALPTLSKFGIRRGKLDEADMFAQWADDIIEESLDIGNTRQVEDLVELLTDMIPVGPNAEVAIGELADVIEDDELYGRLRRTAAANPDSDARPQIIAWMQEQDNEDYRRAIEKIEAEDSDSEEDQQKLKDKDKPRATEPAKVEPKKKQPPADDMGGMSPSQGGGVGGLPPLPPLPPLAEDDALASFKRLLGR